MTLFYNRKIDLTKIKNNGRFLLNFGAVDQETDVYINGKHVGNHKGGYLSFSFDITEYVQQDLSNVDLLVRVFDNLKENGEAYGKQANPRGNIYYITTGGIWQTVWIESVPNNYLKNVKMTPFYDDGKIEFEPECIVNNEKKLKEEKIKYLITDKTGKSINGEIPLTGKSLIEIPKPIFSWSPEEPNLYQVKFTFGEDIVSSYFAMRKFSISEDSRKIKRLFLNNKPYFHIGVLDQGYWSDGFYTAPSDEALKYENYYKIHLKLYLVIVVVVFLIAVDVLALEYSSTITVLVKLGLLSNATHPALRISSVSYSTKASPFILA